jgi:dTDP-4-dehydrorhamnose 3,5-epimerase
MDIRKTDIPDLLVIEPKRFGDDRGYFAETYNRQRLLEAGYDYRFVQDNHSLSSEVGTLRGMHFQAPPYAQAKLVRCVRGSIFDAVMDVRKGSPTYGHSFGLELSAENGLQLMVPEGFLHGFATRAPDSEIVYKVNNHYNREADGSVHWDSCGIDWGLTGDPVLSDKDKAAIPLDQFDSPFEWTPA